jgi:hypothetical protein
MSEQSGWHEEMQSAWLYRVIAEKGAGQRCERLFLSLAEAAETQAGIWVERAAAAHRPFDTRFRPDTRARLVAALVRLLGPRHMRPALAAMKIRGLSVYSTAITTGASDSGHAMPTSAASGMSERRHRGLAAGGNLRAAVFGVNDGLVSNASLISGVQLFTQRRRTGEVVAQFDLEL